MEGTIAIYVNLPSLHDTLSRLVWSPKYRRDVLPGDVQQQVQELFVDIAEQYDITLEDRLLHGAGKKDDGPSRRGFLRFGIMLRKSDEVQDLIVAAGLNLMRYDSRWRKYLVRVTPGEVEQHRETFESLPRRAYEA